MTSSQLEEAYAAVYAVIERWPGDAYRNAVIWRAVSAALECVGATSDPEEKVMADGHVYPLKVIRSHGDVP